MRIIKILCFAMVVFCCTICSTNALGQEEYGVIQIITLDQSEAIEGFVVSLYQIAKADENGDYVIAQEFLDLGYSLEQLGQEITKDMAIGLKTYVERNTISPLEVVSTDEDGMAVFNELPQGIYLFINGNRNKAAAGYLEFTPGVLCIPKRIDHGYISYVVRAFPKIEKVKDVTIPEPIVVDRPEKTGENLNWVIWIGMFLVSLSGVMLLGVLIDNKSHGEV